MFEMLEHLPYIKISFISLCNGILNVTFTNGSLSSFGAIIAFMVVTFSITESCFFIFIKLGENKRMPALHHTVNVSKFFEHKLPAEKI